MASDNHLASIAELCHISSSQEEYLSRSQFAGEPDDESSSDDDSGDIPVASTGIMIVSLPDSLEEREHDASVPRDIEVFHTPPEESAMASSQEQQQTIAIDNRDDRAVEGLAKNGNFAAIDDSDMGDSRAVDLGRDTDLGFFVEAELTERTSHEQQQAVSVDNQQDRTVEGVANNANLAVFNGSCADVSTAVNLGSDTDLGFSAEAELTERIEIDTDSQSSLGVNQVNKNEVIPCESINFRIREGEFDVSDGLCGSPVKKLKIGDKNLGLGTPEPCLGSEAAKTLERVVKSIEKLKSSSENSNNLNQNVVLEVSRDAPGAKAGNLGETVNNLSFEDINPPNSLKSLENHEIEVEVHGGEREFQGTSSAKRELQLRPGVLESNLEDDNAVSAFNEDRVESETEEIEDDKADRSCDSIETFSNSQEKREDKEAKRMHDIGRYRNVGSSGTYSSEKRVLPMSLWPKNGNAEGRAVTVEVLSASDDGEPGKLTLLDVLRELAEGCTYDPHLAKLSVIEVLKMRGMTFP